MNDSTPQTTGTPNDLGNLVSSRLIARVGRPLFELWFDHPDSILQSARSIVITASNDFALQRMQTTFSKDIREIVHAVCGPDFSVVFKTAEETASETTGSNPNEQESLLHVRFDDEQVDGGQNHHDRSAPLLINSSHNNIDAATTPKARKRRTLSLGTFCFGKENSLARASTDQILQQPGRFSPLYVYGPTGCGKSHLLEGLVGDFRRVTRRNRCVYLSAEQFTASFIASLRGAGLPMFRRKHRDVDLLAIDDVQFFEGKRATIGEFQSTIDHLLRLGRQVIVSSDRPPAEITGIAPDLAARLSAGLICPLNYAEFPQRVEIVRSLCEERGYRFSRSVIDLVCERIAGDIRQMSGALNRLHASSIVTSAPVTVSSATEVLVDLFALSGATTSMVRIEKAVCDLCQVQPSELKSNSRKKRICTARMLAMYLAREHTNNAFSEIGDYFGGRSHSTVIAARKKVSGWIQDDHRIDLPHAAYEAKEIVKRIKSSLRVG